MGEGTGPSVCRQSVRYVGRAVAVCASLCPGLFPAKPGVLSRACRSARGCASGPALRGAALPSQAVFTRPSSAPVPRRAVQVLQGRSGVTAGSVRVARAVGPVPALCRAAPWEPCPANRRAAPAGAGLAARCAWAGVRPALPHTSRRARAGAVSWFRCCRGSPGGGVCCPATNLAPSRIPFGGQRAGLSMWCQCW